MREPALWVAMVLTTLVATLMTVLIVEHQRGATRRRLWGIGLLGCYLFVLGLIVLMPQIDAAAAAQTYDGTAPLHRAWTWGTRFIWPWHAAHVSDRFWNMALTVPLGVLLVQLFRMRVRTAALIGLALAVAIECTQLAISLAAGYVYRSFDVNDIVDNVIGATLGAGLAALVRSGRVPAPRRVPH